MIRCNDHKQQRLFDPWGNMSPKRRQMLDRSWSGLFKEYILPELPVSELDPFFNSGFGRPTKELLADSLYGSDENVETAKDKGIDAISPPMASEKEGTLGLSDFHLEKSVDRPGAIRLRLPCAWPPSRRFFPR